MSYKAALLFCLNWLERLRNKTFVRFFTLFMVGALILPDFMLCEEKSIWRPNKLVLSSTGHEYMPNQARALFSRLKKRRFFFKSQRACLMKWSNYPCFFSLVYHEPFFIIINGLGYLWGWNYRGKYPLQHVAKKVSCRIASLWYQRPVPWSRRKSLGTNLGRPSRISYRAWEKSIFMPGMKTAVFHARHKNKLFSCRARAEVYFHARLSPCLAFHARHENRLFLCPAWD